MNNIYGLLLLAVLLGGSIIIFQEQLREFEVRGRTPPSFVEFGGGGKIPSGRSGFNISGGNFTSSGGTTRLGSGFEKTDLSNNLQFSGSGRIVSGPTGDIEGVKIGEVLHTIDRDINTTQARGFVQNITERWQTSPFAGYIAFLDSVRGLGAADPSREYFALITSSLLKQSLNISGWRVFDYRSRTAHTIPDAVLIPGSRGNSELSPIALRPGDTAIVSSGRAPTGSSFLVNKCTGFLSQFKTFTPSIKTTCVDPEEELIRFNKVPFSDDLCYETVKRLSTCRVVTDLSPSLSKNCRELLGDIITERGCVAEHRNDADFYTNEWRIFLNSRDTLWRTDETNALYLVDGENRLVATFVY